MAALPARALTSLPLAHVSELSTVALALARDHLDGLALQVAGLGHPEHERPERVRPETVLGRDLQPEFLALPPLTRVSGEDGPRLGPGGTNLGPAGWVALGQVRGVLGFHTRTIARHGTPPPPPPRCWPGLAPPVGVHLVQVRG